MVTFRFQKPIAKASLFTLTKNFLKQAGLVMESFTSRHTILFSTQICMKWYFKINASGEVARIAEHSKVFGVVAEQVRKIASQSADAAK